jgi:hypothetical protein
MASSTHPGQPDNEDILATYAGAKRRIAALEQQLESLQDTSAKRKSYDLHVFSSSMNSMV